MKNASFPVNYISRMLVKLFAYTSEEGSRQLVWAAVGCAGKEKELQGAFVARSNIAEPSDYVLGEEGKRVQKQLWVRVICSLRSFRIDLWLGPTASRPKQ